MITKILFEIVRKILIELLTSPEFIDLLKNQVSKKAIVDTKHLLNNLNTKQNGKIS